MGRGAVPGTVAFQGPARRGSALINSRPASLGVLSAEGRKGTCCAGPSTLPGLLGTHRVGQDAQGVPALCAHPEEGGPFRCTWGFGGTLEELWAGKRHTIK